MQLLVFFSYLLLMLHHRFPFHFFVQTWIVDCINCNPVPNRNQEPSSRGALNSGLASADSGLQLDLEIALSGFPA
jgi:hypothetical protein